MIFSHKQIKQTLALGACLSLLSCGNATESALEHMQRGESYLAQKDYPRAAIEYKNVLRLNPKSAEAYLRFAELEQQRRSLQKSVAYYSKVLELDPSNYQARLGLAKIYLSVTLPDKASEAITPVLKTQPNDAAAKTVAAAVLFLKGENDKSLRMALEVINADASQVDAIELAANIYRAKGDTDRTIDFLTKAINRDPKLYQLRVALAQIYDERSEPNKAAAILADNIAIDPQTFAHRQLLAAYYTHIKQPKNAEETLREALAKEPKNPDGYLMLSELLAADGRGADAEKNLSTAVEMYPDNFSLRFGLANYYQRANKPDAAINTYQKIIQLEKMEPEGIKARKQLAELFRRRGSFSDASKLLDEVLMSNESDSEALLIRSKIEMSGNKPNLQAAIRDLRVILKGQADSPVILTLLAQAHLQNREPDLARDALEKAVAIAPTDTTANVRFAAFVWGVDHKIDSAERILDKFLSISPGNAYALQAKLDILVARDDGERLLETLAALKKAHPDLPAGYLRSGDYYFSKGKYHDALREYELARAKSNGDFTAVGAIAKTYGKLKDTSRALNILDAYIATSPRNLSALHMKARFLASKNDKAGLFKLVDQCRQFYPDSPIADNWAGEYFLGQRNFVEARRRFTAAAEKAPNDPRYIRAIAASYIAEKKPGDALIWLGHLATSTPDNALPSYLMGKILMSQSRVAEAKTQFKKSLQLLPNSDQENMPKRSEIYVRIANTEFLQNEQQKGMAALKEGLIAAPLDPDLLINLALAYQNHGDASAAIAIYEEMLDRDSENLLARNNLASLLTDKGDGPSLDRARRLAHSFDTSSDARLLDTLGWIYCKQNEVGRAIPLLKKAAEIAPDSNLMRFHLGVAYLQIGDKIAAKSQLTRALSSHAQFASADEARSLLKTLE